jgi:integrase
MSEDHYAYEAVGLRDNGDVYAVEVLGLQTQSFAADLAQELAARWHVTVNLYRIPFVSERREAMAGRANGTGAAISANPPRKPKRYRMSSRLAVLQGRAVRPCCPGRSCPCWSPRRARTRQCAFSISSHVVRKGKTPILDAAEVRALLDSIVGTSHIDLRDKALIGLMLYSFARIGAVVAMKVEDVYTQNRRLWVRLHEKGGKLHDMPCNHNAETYLHAYLDGTDIAANAKGPLFRTVGRDGKLTGNALHRVNAFELVRKRAVAAGIKTSISNHSFRATGITVFRKLGGSLENAALMANHASTRTTQLYDRRSDDVTLDEVERIRF